MNTVKDSLLLLDHYPDSDITVYYMDIRAFGKGFEDLYTDAAKKPASSTSGGCRDRFWKTRPRSNLRLMVENTMTGELGDAHEQEMIVLIAGADAAREAGFDQATVDSFDNRRRLSCWKATPSSNRSMRRPRGSFSLDVPRVPRTLKIASPRPALPPPGLKLSSTSRRYTLEPVVAWIDPERCSACNRCVRVCPFPRDQRG